MASTSKCPYCGGTVRSDEKNCPHCGAANELYVADTPRVITAPQTIAELQEYCAERGMPLLRMRFFIGEDFREPRAFGIYQDGRDFVVYKNKADGSRSIRYRGPDEANAVNELYQKLLSECHNRGIYPDGTPAASTSASTPYTPKNTGGQKKQSGRLLFLMALPLIVLGSIAVAIGSILLITYFVPLLLVAAVTAAIILILRFISKRTKPLPSGRWGAREDRDLDQKLTPGERLGFCFRRLIFPVPAYGLTHREQKLSNSVMSPKLFRFLVSLVLALALIPGVWGIVHSNDGYYANRDGTISYHYGAKSYLTGGQTSSPYDPLDISHYGSEAYIGSSWDSSWGDSSYDPPSFWDDVDSLSTDLSSGSSSGSSDSSSGWDSDWDSGYDSWDSGGTDWDSDW